MSGTIGSIGGSGGAASSDDIEFQILCDNNAGVITRFLRRFVYSAGILTTVDTELDGTTVYAPTGTVGACEGTTQITTECLRVAYDGAGFTSGDRILRLTTFDMTQSPVDAVSTVYFNQNTGAPLAVAPNLSLLYPCDTEIISTESCYKALTANPPYYNAGETLTAVTVLDVSNIGGFSSILTIFYNVSAGTTFDSNAHSPVSGTDIEPCSSASDSEFIILCDNNAGAITRFLRRYSVTNGTASTVDTELDGTTAYTPSGTVEICRQCGQIEVLCDDNGSFLRNYGCDGIVTDTALDGTTAYTVAGTVKRCEIKNADPVFLCDDAGQFLRHLIYAADGLSVTTFDTALDGTTAYTATGTVKRCDSATAYQLLCDHTAGTVVPFLRRFTQTETGSLVVTDTALDAVTAYAVAGAVGNCALTNVDPVILCDDNGSFLRHILYSEDGTTVTLFDTDLDGLDYTTVGAVKSCSSSSEAYLPLCDTVTTPSTPPSSPTTITAPDIQDGEQKTNGGGVVLVNDDDVQFGLDAGNNDKIGAIRFTVNVPQGATITEAYIQFTCQDASGNPSNLTIQAEAADNAPAFVAVVNSLATRPKTAAVVNWSPAAWSAGAAGPAQKTPDIKSVVQEVVNRAGWVANNVMAIYIDGTGMRDAVGLATSAAQAPVLTITYTTGTAGTPTTTTTARFYRKIVDGQEIGDYWIDPADGVWKTYTVQGTVASCADDKHFQIMCLQDNAGQFSRVIAVDQATGDYSVVGDFTLDFSTTYVTTGSVRACEDMGTRDTETVILCDDTGSFLRHIVYGDNGAAVMAFDTTLDGLTVYAPVGTVKVCDRDALPLDARMANVAGTAAVATVQNIAALIPAGKVLVSLSITVLAGTASVTDFAGTAITALPVGYSASWSADPSGSLNYPVSVTAAINSRVVLAYTLR